MPPQTAAAAAPPKNLDVLFREHAARLSAAYAKVLAETGWDGVLLHSGTAKIRTQFDDQYWPLRPTPHFAHWCPLAVADCAVLVLPGATPVLYRNVSRSFWEGTPEPEGDHFWGSFQVVEVSHPDQLKGLLPAGKKLAFIGEDGLRAARWGFDLDRRNPDELVGNLDAIRVTKTAYELACLREANRRAALGHRRVLRDFHGGDPAELDLHLAYLQATGQDDPETPYKNIVALGRSAAILHHVHYGRRAEPGPTSILLDAGATYLGYASDITRTDVRGKGADADAFRAMLDGMERLQQELCRRVRVGMPYETLHDESHALLASVMRDVGLARGSDDELVEGGVTRAFFPHGLGHSLGLQTHDVGCAGTNPAPKNPWLRNTSTIQVGQVFTIEPGIYFIDDLMGELRAGPRSGNVDWALVDRMAAYGGVRIEDDLAVTDRGVVNLTREVLPT